MILNRFSLGEFLDCISRLYCGLYYLLLHNLFFNINIYNSLYGVGNGRYFYKLNEFPHLIFAALRFNTQEQLLGVFWFINSLFFGSLVFYLTLKIFKKPLLRVGVIFIICLGLVYKSIEIPYIGFRTFFSALFIIFGYIYKLYEYQVTKKIKYYVITLGPVIVAALSLFIKTEMMQVTASIIIPYTIIALIGCISLIYISEILSENVNLVKRIKRIINYMGTHTFAIMTLHFLAFKIVTFCIISYYNYPIEMLATFPVISYCKPNSWWILYSTVGVVCPLLLCYLYELICSQLKRSFKCYIY